MLSQISKCVLNEENMTLGKCRVTDSRTGSLPGTTVIWRMRDLTEKRAVTKEECVLCTLMAVLNLPDYYFHIDCVKLIWRFRIWARCLLYHTPCFQLASELHPGFPEIFEKYLSWTLIYWKENHEARGYPSFITQLGSKMYKGRHSGCLTYTLRCTGRLWVQCD